jgi:bacterial leucyl aminopeptidase
MNQRHHCTCIAFAAALWAAGAPPSHAVEAPVWVSMGEDAYRLLQAQDPRWRAAEVHELSVAAPSGSRLAPWADEAAMAERSDRVVLLQADPQALRRIAGAVHDKLRRCGGYIAHASLADARAVVLQMKRHAHPNAVDEAAARPGYAIDNRPTVEALLPRVQESNVLTGIQTLSGYRNRYFNSPHGIAASQRVAQTWRRWAGGRNDVAVELYDHKSWPQQSVVLTISGSDAADEIVVIGGHLDSITKRLPFADSYSPGADDNASGIASFQEAMRVLLASGWKPRRTVQFMAYAAEEEGLRGSAAIAQRYAKEGRKVVGMMNLDMTNYPGPSADIVLMTDYSSTPQNRFIARLAGAYLPGLRVGQDVCGYACSDHASWTANGYAASIPAEALYDEGSPYLHTTKDTLARSGNNAEHAVKFARLALAYAVELGSDGPVSSTAGR